MKIGTVVSAADRSGQRRVLPSNNLVDGVLGKSPMYKLVNVLDLRPPSDLRPGKGLNQFLDGCAKRDVLIVLFADSSDDIYKALKNQIVGGDTADEFIARINAKAYSTRKKQQKAQIAITEQSSSIAETDSQQKGIVLEQLKARATEKLIMRLLENDVF